MSATTRDVRARIEQRRHPFEARYDSPADQERRARYMDRHRESGGNVAALRIDACTTRDVALPGCVDTAEDLDR